MSRRAGRGIVQGMTGVASKAKAPTYDGVALGVLVYEFPFSDKAEIEAKIKGRLRRKKLGAYDPERIALLRGLKDDLQAEIGRERHSAYFTGLHGRYVEMEDFDTARLAADMRRRHPGIAAAEIAWFVPFAVFTYYLR